MLQHSLMVLIPGEYLERLVCLLQMMDIFSTLRQDLKDVKVAILISFSFTARNITAWFFWIRRRNNSLFKILITVSLRRIAWQRKIITTLIIISQNKFCHLSWIVTLRESWSHFYLFYYAFYLDSFSDEIILIRWYKCLILTLDICNTNKSGYFVITYNNVNSHVLIMQLV